MADFLRAAWGSTEGFAAAPVAIINGVIDYQSISVPSWRDLDRSIDSSILIYRDLPGKSRQRITNEPIRVLSGKAFTTHSAAVFVLDGSSFSSEAWDADVGSPKRL